jgi:hypothetical protein
MWIAQIEHLRERVPPPAYDTKSTKSSVIGFIQKRLISFIS